MSDPGESRPGSIEDALQGKNATQMAGELANWLGVKRDVSPEVVTAVLTHPGYARRLAVVRDFPEAVNWLLDHPPALPSSAARMAGLMDDTPSPTTGELVSRAAKSLMRWTAGGFRYVDDETRERRLNACRACPHFKLPPDTGVYRLVGKVRAQTEICGKCGCVVAAKARLPHEQCPDVHPDDPTQSRWGEPYLA